MPTDVFYAILKLVSGEEIISKVCAFIENDEVLIVLDNPIVVDMFQAPNIKVPFIKVTPWISLLDEDTHIINRKSVITMNEIKDESLIKVHKQYIRNKDKKSNQTDITSGMGYISSVKDARKSLEKIYQSQSFQSKSE